jgi:hypothetical protein
MSGKNKRIKSVYKMGWEHPNPISILHALYRYAENEDGRYDFTLSQLEQSNTSTKGVSPIALFGVDSSEVRKILQGLATEHPDHIDVEFTRGLDNIFLRKERHSLDVLRLNRT